MPHTSRIPTPFKQHLHRFRLGILPIVSFLLCVVFTLWLWQRQVSKGSTVGEVEATVVDVTAGSDGQLVALPERPYWEAFDVVSAGDVIAYLDDTPIQAQMRTVQAEAGRLMAELEAARIDLNLDQFTSRQEHERDELRLRWEVERRRIEVFQANATLEALKAQLQNIQRTLEVARRNPGGLVNGSDLRQQEEILQRQLAANQLLMNELNTQYNTAVAKLKDFPQLLAAEADAVLKPIRAATEVQEARIAELRVQLDNLAVRSPIDGVISSVYRFPGQRIAAGDPIVSIARPNSSYVISYVREQQRIALYEGMEVGLRLGVEPGAPEYTSNVESVGPQVTQVPPHQQSDQTVREWATPIRIRIPPELQQQDLRPGQLVHVIFRSRGGE